MAARCSSTRSASCRCARRPSCCARFRKARSGGSARTWRAASTCASSPPRIAICGSEVAAGAFRLDLLLPARRRPHHAAAAARAAARTCPLLAEHFWSDATDAHRQPRGAGVRQRWPRWRAMIGPATCANCRTCWRRSGRPRPRRGVVRAVGAAADRSPVGASSRQCRLDAGPADVRDAFVRAALARAGGHRDARRRRAGRHAPGTGQARSPASG